MSELIQLILTFRNKRWEFPREASSLLHYLVYLLNDNIEGSLYVDDFLICYRGKNMNTIERQLQLCLYSDINLDDIAPIVIPENP